MEASNNIPDFSAVTEFERRIAEFFGAPYAVAVDSCTHGIELCLRYQKATSFLSPKKTYLSIPMLANKLDIRFSWSDNEWQDYYILHTTRLGGFSPTEANYKLPLIQIIDAAVYWKQNGYIKYSFMCLSFQHQKHLSLGRGGMILCDNKEAAETLRHMSYDGRQRGIPWREQNINTMGYHYYMTPETAALGLSKLDVAIATEPRIWSYADYPDLTTMDVFKK